MQEAAPQEMTHALTHAAERLDVYAPTLELLAGMAPVFAVLLVLSHARRAWRVTAQAQRSFRVRPPRA